MLLTYYGDDFTGSTDVLEALHSEGVEAVLFVTPPSTEMLRRYSHIRAFGIAGNSRMMSAREMDGTLPDIFKALVAHRPRFVHYKVCSTFDSSPEIGSIGRAIDIGHRVFQNRLIPLAVGVPTLGRYCAFGNLFARSGLKSAPYRLDRHPTMQHHPITPMDEADLRVHLSRQTARPIELVDVLALEDGYDAVRNRLERLKTSGSIVLFDTLTDEHLETIGRLIFDLQEQEQKPLFAAGSSGIDYALVKYWHATAIAPSSEPLSSHLPEPAIPPVDRTLVLSGSCSPVTDRQIDWALKNGFTEVAIDTTKLLDSKQIETQMSEVAKRIASSLDNGQSVVAHTCRGPTDPRIGTTKRAIESYANGDHHMGVILGRILREVLRIEPVRRVAIVGGDTAGQVARALGVEAVEMIGPLEPGAPLCVVRGRDSTVDGLEVTFKGGQVGYDDFFGTLLSGRCKHSLIGAAR